MQKLTMHEPPHVGEALKQELIIERGLTVTKAAALLGVARPTLSSLLNGKASLSIEMAVRLEKVFGANRETLLRMQLASDLAEARRIERAIKLERWHDESKRPS